MERITQRRSVKYSFNEQELLEMSSELAHKSQEMRQLEEQKKSVVSDFASRINVVKEVISQVADRIAGGSEMRDMEFEVNYHSPERNMKTLTNVDSGIIRTEKMVLADFDLFSQFMDDEKEEVVYDAEKDEEEPDSYSLSTKKGKGRPKKTIEPVEEVVATDDLPM